MIIGQFLNAMEKIPEWRRGACPRAARPHCRLREGWPLKCPLFFEKKKSLELSRAFYAGQA